MNGDTRGFLPFFNNRIEFPVRLPGTPVEQSYFWQRKLLLVNVVLLGDPYQ